MSDDELGFVCPHCIRPAKYVAEMTLGEILSLRHNSPHQAVKIDVLKMEINHKANRIAELEAALKPFAWHVTTEVLFEDLPDEHVIERCGIKLGDLRAARAAMEKQDD